MKIRFEPSGYETEARVGDAVVDITDDHPRAEVPYSCRSANCGTCRVFVVEGMEAFPDPEDEELDVLEACKSGKAVRLSCQLRVEREVDRIVLRVVEPL